MTLERSLLKRIVEAALFSAGQPVSLEKLAELFYEEERPTHEQFREILAEIEADYADRSVQLKEVASGFRFQAVPEVGEWVSRLWEEKPQRYSRALLETLALIAYRQPITRGEVEDIRGVSVSTHIIKTLQEREWVRVLGYRDVPGRPAMYGTTKAFLDYFSLRNLEELPTLAEVRDLDKISAELDERLQQAQPQSALPLETTAGADDSVNPEATSDVPPEAPPETDSEVKAEVKAEATPEVLTPEVQAEAAPHLAETGSEDVALSPATVDDIAPDFAPQAAPDMAPEPVNAEASEMIPETTPESAEPTTVKVAASLFDSDPASPTSEPAHAENATSAPRPAVESKTEKTEKSDRHAPPSTPEPPPKPASLLQNILQRARSIFDDAPAETPAENSEESAPTPIDPRDPRLQ